MAPAQRLMCVRLAAVLALATQVLHTSAQNMVLLGLPNTATVGYTFPQVGGQEMSIEVQDSGGSRDRFFCSSVNPSNPGSCAFGILARMTYSNPLTPTATVNGGGYFQTGLGRFTTPASFTGFLNSLLTSPILLQTGTLQITVTSTGRPTLTHSITVVPDVPNFLFFQLSATTAQAGTNVQGLVQVLDANNNVVTNVNNLAPAVATITGTSTTFPTQSVTLTQGAGTFTFSSSTVETVTVSMTHPAVSLGNSSQSVTITAADTATIQWNESAVIFVSETAPALPTLQLVALDRFGNLNTGEARSINIAMNGVDIGSAQTFASGSLTLVIPGSLSAGDYNFTLLPGTDFLQVVTTTLVTLRVTVVCDGIRFFQNIPNQTVCQNVTTICAVGTFEAAGPTSTSDRNCTLCNGVTEFQNLPNQTSCLPMSRNCTAGEFLQVAPSASTDIVCAACAVDTFSTIVNAPICTNVTECVPGQEMVLNYTSSSDRVCTNCAAGFVDEDSDPATPCTSCISSLSAAATFATRGITVTFSEAFNSTVTIAVTGANTSTSIATWFVREGNCAFGNTSAVYACGETNPATPCGALTAQHGTISSLSLSGAASLDPVLGLSGSNSVYERALTLHDSTGTQIDCSDISPWMDDIPTITTTSGQTQCVNVTECPAGTEEQTPFSYSVDRTCRSCVLNSTFKNDTVGRFCAPVQRCGTGFSESSAPTTSSDTVCTGVTCPSLNPPAFGNITNCRGTGFVENFLQTCTYSCDVSLAFRPVSVTRTCQGNGQFDGVAPECVCEGSLHLDTVNGECVSTCPPGFIANSTGSTTSCRQCSAACTSGTFESTPCDPVTNTDRSCSTCTTCGAGTFAVGGCFPNNNTDTVCAPFSECPVGSYEVVAGTPFSDRQCGTCRVCPNTSTTELYAAGGCCSTVDTICDGVSTCPAGFFESAPPGLAPQGGLGSDKRCQRIRQCGAGEYVHAEPTRVADVAVSDRDCRSCTQCGSGTFTLVNCTASADTVCVPHPPCPSGQFRTGANPWSNGTCTTCTTCADFEFIERACGGANDTVCTAHTICDPVTEYETVTPTTTADRQCGNCTVCGAGEVIAEQCDTNTPGRCSTNSSEEVCPRGTAEITNVFGLSFCAPCADCPAGTFTKGGARCPNTQPQLGYTDPRCFNATTCPSGFAELVAPTPTSDRECVRCATCPSGSYSMDTSTCVATVAELNCTIDAACPAGQYTSVAGTPSQPRQCASCRTCSSGEYAVVQCGGLFDAVCRAHTECASNEALLRPGTATTDSVCRPCPAEVQGTLRPNNDPFLCPPIPFASSCPAPAPTPAPSFDSIFSEVRFSFDANYSEIVGRPEHLERHELFNSELLAYLSAQLAQYSPTPLSLVTSAPGSILVTVVVLDTNQSGTVTSHSAAAADLFAILAGAFTFMYEGNPLTVESGSITISQVDPNSGAPTTQPTVALQTSPPTAAVSTTQDPSLGSVGESSDKGLSRGALAAIIVAVVIVLVNIVAITIHRSRKGEAYDGSNTVYNPNADHDDDDENDYLNMTAHGEPDAGDDNLFSNQVATENRRLKEEIDTMDLKISEKNAVINAQVASRTHAEHVLEVAVASRLADENRAIQREIAAMKKELRKKQEVSKFQRVAAKQAKLKAERAALEEEIVTADNVAQTALQAVSKFGSLEEAMVDQTRDEEAEHERIAAEKARLSAEMAKMTERLASM
eukprot:m.435325 g.435325  ORF g.435325 m.435325 type:complete len:1707 (+) comp17836_c0_seq1:94-5214(+)